MNPIKHVAIIMDGNGRWGLKHNKSRNYGHRAGLRTVEKIIKVSLRKKIPYLTLFAFSTENWRRPKKEISFLFRLIQNYFLKEIKSIERQGIKINILGELSKIPFNIKSTLKSTVLRTKKNKRIIVNLAINYGSKNEIIYAAKKIKRKINIQNIEKNLYTSSMPDPDILIRTGGHKRLSNFMLWQLAYSELYFVKKLWPDFRINDLRKIINDYKKTRRNFGAI